MKALFKDVGFSDRVFHVIEDVVIPDAFMGCISYKRRVGSSAGLPTSNHSSEKPQITPAKSPKSLQNFLTERWFHCRTNRGT